MTNLADLINEDCIFKESDSYLPVMDVICLVLLQSEYIQVNILSTKRIGLGLKLHHVFCQMFSWLLCLRSLTFLRSLTMSLLHPKPNNKQSNVKHWHWLLPWKWIIFKTIRLYRENSFSFNQGENRLLLSLFPRLNNIRSWENLAPSSEVKWQ